MSQHPSDPLLWRNSSNLSHQRPALAVRTGRSMDPTARAQEIAGLPSPALDSISTAVSRASPFDPATSELVFRIGLTDDVEFALLP